MLLSYLLYLHIIPVKFMLADNFCTLYVLAIPLFKYASCSRLSFQNIPTFSCVSFSHFLIGCFNSKSCFGLHKKLGVGGVVLVSSVIWIEVLDGGLNTNDEPFDVAVTIGVVA